VIFGEKQIYMGGDKRPDWAAMPNLFEYEPKADDSSNWCGVDGSWLTTTAHRGFSIFRPVHFNGPVSEIETKGLGNFPGIQPKNEWRDLWWPWPPHGFGSWHTGTTNFSVGDGSVAAISDTISPRILAKLGIVNDGMSVAIP